MINGTPLLINDFQVCICPTYVSKGTCEHLEISSAEDQNGRRFYVHEASFAYLASQSIFSARLIYSTLAPIAIIKTVYHYLISDGVKLGLVTLERAAPLVYKITEHWSGKITKVLRQIGFRPADPGQRHGFYPLLTYSESVVAVCYDVQYYTFATSKAAAVRMYNDTEDIQKVKLFLREGRGHSDLTLIKGASLALVDPSIGVGDDKASYYREQLKVLNTIPKEILVDLKREIAYMVKRELESLVETYLASPTKDETLILDGMFEACSRAVNKGILKTMDD